MLALRKNFFLIFIFLFIATFVFYILQFEFFSVDKLEGNALTEVKGYTLYAEVIQNIVPDEEYYTDWDYKKSPVFLAINETFPETNTMNISISLPSDKSFSNKDQLSSVKCLQKDTTVVVSYDFLPFLQNEDVYTFAEPGDYLYTYCQDTSCSALGGSCVLVRFLPLEEDIAE